MKLIVNNDKLKIESAEKNNSGSINYYEVEVEFNSAWDGLTKELLIRKEKEEKGNSKAIIDNHTKIDRKFGGTYYIGIIGYSVEYNLTEDTEINKEKIYYIRTGEEGNYIYTKIDNPVEEEISNYYEAIKTYQISTNLKQITINQGAGGIEVENEKIPEATEWEAYMQQIESILDDVTDMRDQVSEMLEGAESIVQQASNLNISSQRVSDGVEISITNKEGETTTTKVNDGYTPVKGVDYFTQEDKEDLKEELIEENHFVQDANYVHTDNNFTDEEKEKLSELENYDDTSIRNELANKVDKEAGKGLSSNDFTTLEKTKLAGLENYNDTELRQRVTNAEDDIDDLETTVAGHTTQIGEIEAEIPEAIGEHNQSSTSHLDIRQLISNLQSNKQDNLTAGSNITIVNNVISATPGLRFEVVQTLPATGDSNVIYLVPNSGTTPNIYDEYIYVNNSFELIGTTEIDLSNYVQKSDMPYVDLSNYSIGDVISDTEIVTNLKNKRVLVKYNASYYRLAIINSTNSYIYTTMNNTTSGDYIVLYEDNNILTFLVADTTEWEVTVNKVTSVSSSSTDTEYPTAKCLYDLVGNINTILVTLTTVGGV